MRKLTVLILTNLLLILPPVVLAPGEVAFGAEKKDRWMAYIYVGVHGASKRLVLGQDKNATEGHDDYWESPVPKMFLESGIIRPYFFHPQWRKSSPFFWRDMRALGGLPKTWEFFVKTKKPRVEVQIKWDLNQVKKGVVLYLKMKEDKRYINLQKEKRYIYKSSPRGNRFFVKDE